LMSGTSAASLHRVGQWRPTWFFPPEAVWSIQSGFCSSFILAICYCISLVVWSFTPQSDLMDDLMWDLFECTVFHDSNLCAFFMCLNKHYNMKLKELGSLTSPWILNYW
jgi:hypothetical protein